MDYTGIINLALVTLFYSTILAPGLKRIGDIKDEISSIDFPIIKRSSDPSGEDIDTIISEKGIELTKKLTQYEDKYNETNRFLKYFYMIIGIIIIAQIVVMYAQNTLLSMSSILLIPAVCVILVVIILVKSYMTDPSVVRSIQWLANKGISNAHTDILFKPTLVLNGQVANIIPNDERVTLSLRSYADLNGYGYLLTIESENNVKLYALSAGFINNIQAKTTISFPSGESGADIALFNLKLNPGSYKARLLLVSQVYPGNYPPGETIMNFEVPKKGNSPVKSQSVNLRNNTCGIIFTLKNKSNKQKIIHMEANESFDGANNISFIFSSASLLKYLSKGHRPVVFYSRHGDLDRYDLEKYLRFYQILKRRVYKRFKKPLKAFRTAKGPLILLNRNPKSNLRVS